MVVGGIFYVASEQIQPNRDLQPEITVSSQEDTVSDILSEFHDPSGFSFQYPNDFSVTNKTTENTSVYSDLLITSEKHNDGSISILIEDTKLKDFNAWLQKEALATSSAKISESSFSHLPSHTVVRKDKTQVITLDKGVLFTITLLAQKDKKYFQSAFDTILSSFQFGQSDNVSESSGVSGENDIIMEEEIIE